MRRTMGKCLCNVSFYLFFILQLWSWSSLKLRISWIKGVDRQRCSSQPVYGRVTCRPCTSKGFSSPPKKHFVVWKLLKCHMVPGVCVSWGGSHPLTLCCRERLQHPLWPWLGTESGWRCAGAEYIPLNPSTSSLLGDSLKLRKIMSLTESFLGGIAFKNLDYAAVTIHPGHR